MRRLVDTESVETSHDDFEGATSSTEQGIDPEGHGRHVPEYALLYFDHLYSEYLALKSSIEDTRLVELLEEINQKRRDHGLAWSEIYTFDLALVDARPLENLIRKAYDARAKYRSIAGQKEYDEYVASKPPDLTAIQIAPDAEPPDPGLLIKRALRADIKYLLNKFYMYYALLPVREGLRDQLTTWGVIITVVSVGLVLFAILINVGSSFFSADAKNWLDVSAVFGLTVATVTLAGILGGCVSMLQRIQSAPTEGDAISNLAALNNGWRGLFLSPLYGGIFASLLFVIFSAGILSGSVFPVINTPKSIASRTVVPAADTAANEKGQAATKAGGTDAGQSAAVLQGGALSTSAATPQGSTQASAGSSVPATSPAAASPARSPAAQSDIVQIKDFLNQTGPADGVSFALLIIWSFIAGFAERLVPDTLNRLVAKNEAQGN